MRKILGAIRRADEKFNLIAPKDRIAIGLSGGKDSMLLLYALQLYKMYIKKDYEITAINIDLGFGNFNYKALTDYTTKLEIPLEIVKTDISDIVFNIRKEKNPCSLCAKMRKGAFYETAQRLGCNKSAFAHHADDASQTFLMSLMYEARINTFSPKAFMSRSGVTLIRPLICVEEKDIITAVKKYEIPVAKNPCPIDFSTKREQAKQLICHLNTLNENSGKNIFNAILNTSTYNLWDKIN